MKDCCSKATKSCIRSDGKIFLLPRRFSKKRCIKGPIRGFTMRSSCAPYKFCKKTKKGGSKKIKMTREKTKKKQFLFNPDDPKHSFDVYIDKNPDDTIPIKYTTLGDVKNTIKKLEKLYKMGKYTHKRIWQVGMIMYVRLKVLKIKKPQQFNLSKKYFKFLGERTKINGDNNRKNYIFKF